MKKMIIIFTVLILITSTGCINNQEKSNYPREIEYNQTTTENNFSNNSNNYEDTYLDVNYEDNLKIHIKTFAPSTNYRIKIDNVYVDEYNSNNKVVVNASVQKTGDIGGTAITPLTKTVVTDPIENLVRVDLNINNTMGGNSSVSLMIK